MPDIGWVSEYIPDSDRIEELGRQVRSTLRKFTIPEFHKVM